MGIKLDCESLIFIDHLASLIKNEISTTVRIEEVFNNSCKVKIGDSGILNDSIVVCACNHNYLHVFIDVHNGVLDVWIYDAKGNKQAVKITQYHLICIQFGYAGLGLSIVIIFIPAFRWFVLEVIKAGCAIKFIENSQIVRPRIQTKLNASFKFKSKFDSSDGIQATSVISKYDQILCIKKIRQLSKKIKITNEFCCIDRVYWMRWCEINTTSYVIKTNFHDYSNVCKYQERVLSDNSTSNEISKSKRSIVPGFTNNGHTCYFSKLYYYNEIDEFKGITSLYSVFSLTKTLSKKDWTYLSPKSVLIVNCTTNIYKTIGEYKQYNVWSNEKIDGQHHTKQVSIKLNLLKGTEDDNKSWNKINERVCKKLYTIVLSCVYISLSQNSRHNKNNIIKGGVLYNTTKGYVKLCQASKNITYISYILYYQTSPVYLISIQVFKLMRVIFMKNPFI